MIFKMSDIDQTVTVYKLHPETNEFIGSDNAFIPAHTGLPANCTTIKPPLTKDGFVAIFNTEKQKWIAIKDHRGEIVFDTKDARRFVITAPGDYPAGTTTLEPENAWQKWNGIKWEDDAESMRVALTREAELEKIRLLKQAHTAIATLQDAVVLGMASQKKHCYLPHGKNTAFY